jgi:hypothetical protein
MPPAPAVPRTYWPHPMGPPMRAPVWYAGRPRHARLSARALGTGSAQEVV